MNEYNGYFLRLYQQIMEKENIIRYTVSIHKGIMPIVRDRFDREVPRPGKEEINEREAVEAAKTWFARFFERENKEGIFDG